MQFCIWTFDFDLHSCIQPEFVRALLSKATRV
jgi:hypothetical protein